MNFLINVILVWNVFVLAAYGLDKLKAMHNAWRIPEKALLGCSLCLGGFGAIMGMVIFRHKTNNTLFRVIVPISLLITYAVLINLK